MRMPASEEATGFPGHRRALRDRTRL